MQKDGNWKTLNSQTVHESPWIRVDDHEVINPGGALGKYSTIHFKNLAIGILPIDSEGFVHLVGQYRYPIKQYSWEIPEGGCPEGEEPLETAVRELKEEAGFAAGCMKEIVKCHLSNSASDEYCMIYLATDLVAGEAEPEIDEEFEYKRVTIQEFMHLVNSGEITDSLTVMAALKLETMLLKGELKY